MLVCTLPVYDTVIIWLPMLAGLRRLFSFLDRRDSDRRAAIEAFLGESIRDISLYEQAFSHKSVDIGNQLASNQRLEYLGDAVLGMVVAEYLYQAFPGEMEGFLTQLRAKLVKGTTLTRVARSLDLGSMLRISSSQEKVGTRDSDRVLADAIEATIGALYLDRGMRVVRRFIIRTMLSGINLEALAARQDNHKSALLETAQKRGWPQPTYTMVATSGPPNARRFTTSVSVGNKLKGVGTASTKKEAEQLASRAALQKLEQKESAKPSDKRKNYKGKLNELVMAKKLPLPQYEVIDQQGPPHAPTFKVEVRVGTLTRAKHHGRSIKRAEQGAARKALAKLTPRFGHTALKVRRANKAARAKSPTTVAKVSQRPSSSEDQPSEDDHQRTPPAQTDRQQKPSNQAGTRGTSGRKRPQASHSSNAPDLVPPSGKSSSPERPVAPPHSPEKTALPSTNSASNELLKAPPNRPSSDAMGIDLGFGEHFEDRHIGPSEENIQGMLEVVGAKTLEELIRQAVPKAIRTRRPLNLPPGCEEHTLLDLVREIGRENLVFRSYIGMGYHDTVTPRPILRGIMENPSWYTQYTPYQAEISQGRLEALLNFQTMVIDLTGMEIANASLLDEATAAAEAMTMFHRLARKKDRNTFLLSSSCHPQTLAVVQGRAAPLGIKVVVSDHHDWTFSSEVFGALLQYPATDGALYDYRSCIKSAHDAGTRVAVCADLLSLAILEAPGTLGADAVVGSSQRFGVPLGYGGPHAAYFATREAFKRQVPGRMIGVSVDADGKPALRMALQMREQHIKRARATSNICTAQVLLAVIAQAYALYHGPDGLRRIATRIHNLTRVLATGIQGLGYTLRHTDFFDTVCVENPPKNLRTLAEHEEVNFRYLPDGAVCVALDETVLEADLTRILFIFGKASRRPDVVTAPMVAATLTPGYQGAHARTTPFMEHPVFSSYHSETELTRYLHRLASRDLSLTTSMIPLGSCTMKLNAATQLAPITWAWFSRMHPFAPTWQAEGYRRVFQDLETWLAEITGYDGVSLQPNSGASGEYAGLLVIRAWHESRGEEHRNICIVPDSAHGTNPASAVMAGMKVVVVKTTPQGNIDLGDLKSKIARHQDALAALMVTYPSTYGVFDEDIREICDLVHENGGQVYMDGANMNAQIGLCRPGTYGPDVCHLNLHKTFAIPHGGGGPGMGPICVAAHLTPFLPGHPVIPTGGNTAIGPVAAAPYGSASILLISWAYILLLGERGLKRSAMVAILNANYLAERLSKDFPVLFRGARGRVAHEFILDLRPLKAASGIDALDVAKRLIDYGYHAPTMSWPVVGTMMVEPTESEGRAELDRFVEAMQSIGKEIDAIAQGEADPLLNPLKQAPHTMSMVTREDYDLPYSRTQAAFPSDWTKAHKFWPYVRRVDNATGDRNLICACPPVDSYESPDQDVE